MPTIESRRYNGLGGEQKYTAPYERFHLLTLVEFDEHVSESVPKWFQIRDRGLRTRLLSDISLYMQHLSSSQIKDVVYPAVQQVRLYRPLLPTHALCLTCTGVYRSTAHNKTPWHQDDASHLT